VGRVTCHAPNTKENNTMVGRNVGRNAQDKCPSGR
jgi:hypothetical protein